MSTLECEEPILKRVRFEKEFTLYPHFIVYDFEAKLILLNEHPTDDLTYLSRDIPISVAVHDTLSKEPAYLVHQNPESLTEQFIEVLTEARSNICRCFEAASISFRFSNASRRSERTMEAMG